MQRLRELSRRVEAVYGEIAETFSTYQQSQGLQCRSGCGECCLAPTIEATVLEHGKVSAKFNYAAKLAAAADDVKQRAGKRAGLSVR